MPSVPFIDLKQNTASIRQDVESAFSNIMGNTSYILGKHVSEFEKQFSEFCQTSECIGVSSGLEALTIALRCLNIGPGDEVLLPANTYIATALAVSSSGATPVLCDVDETTGLMDFKDASQRISNNTRMLIPVHLFGRMISPSAMENFAQQHQVTFIEDAAQAHGAVLENKKAGSVGLAGCFSFYPGKNLGAFGDGGAITCNDKELAQSIRSYRNYGSLEKYIHDTKGSNNRLDTLQAAVLLIKLQYIADWNKNRIEAAKRYTHLLQDIPDIQCPELVENGSHVYHLYPIRVPQNKRDSIIKFLTEKNIGVGIHYPIPIHLQNCYKELGYKEGDFPISEKIAKEMISLPMYPELTLELQEYVTQELKDAFEKHD